MPNPIEAYLKVAMPKEPHQDTQEAIREKTILTFTVFALLAALYSAIKWYKQDVTAVATAATIVVFFSIAVILLTKHRILKSVITANLAVLGMSILVSTIIYQLGGIHSAHILWVIGLIIFAYLLTDSKSGSVWAALSFVFTLLLIIGDRSGYAFPVHELAPKQKMINDYSGYLLPLILLWTAQFYGTKIREQALAGAKQALSDANSLSDKSTRMSDNLSEVIAQAKSNSETLLDTSGQLSKTVANMGQRSSSICHGVDQQASASTQITQTLSSMANSVQSSTDIMSNIRDQTTRSENKVARGTEAMSGAIRNMEQIEESNNGISTAMSVISDIADQTNLLALNAAIEAARAGEQGRGFSVVADEVRNLSIKSNESARQIRELLVKAETDVKEGVTAVNQAGELLSDVVASVQEITQQVSQVADVMFKQSADIEDIVRSSESVTQISQENSESGQALTEGAEALSEVADKLADMASNMHDLIKSH